MRGMQCDVEFEYQFRMFSRTYATHGKPLLSWPIAGSSDVHWLLPAVPHLSTQTLTAVPVLLYLKLFTEVDLCVLWFRNKTKSGLFLIPFTKYMPLCQFLVLRFLAWSDYRLDSGMPSAVRCPVTRFSVKLVQLCLCGEGGIWKCVFQG
jgi:hypothetical protein